MGVTPTMHRVQEMGTEFWSIILKQEGIQVTYTYKTI